MFNYGSSSGSPSSSNSNADLSRSYTATWDDQNRPRGGSGGGHQGGGELELARLKARILAHPLYEQLLAAHVACLRAATPASHFHRIDATLANCHHIAAQHLALHAGAAHFPGPPSDKDDLDLFMVNYILLLQTFKEQLQQHVTIQASEAIAACWEIEKALYNLTGASIEEGGGALMPEDEMEEEELHFYGGGGSGGGTGGAMPLVRLGLDSFQQPTDAEKSLLHHVRRELKNELKKEYQSKLKDVREEILRKRRAGKLPGDTANVLKDWWNAHSKWPYPTEEEKARLVEETGLELKQINNWFINQRKRNWQTENVHAAAASSDTFSSCTKQFDTE